MSKVEWPEEWDLKKGWPPGNGKGRLLSNDPRSWITLMYYLRQRGQTLGSQIEALGGPPARAFNEVRTLQGIKTQIQDFYSQTGTRPTPKSGKVWNANEQWLYRNGWTLHSLCNSLGVGQGRSMNRNLEELKKEIQRYFVEHKTRPQTWTPSGEWVARGLWLKRLHKISLSDLCDTLGLPKAQPHKKYSLEEVKTRILEHFQTHHERPTSGIVEWRNINAWLYRHHTSLQRVCDELGLSPKGSNNCKAA